MTRRHLVSAGAFLAAGAAIWSARRDPTGRRRTWQDIAAGTRVIDTRWGADPLEKAPAADPAPGTDGEADLVVVATDSPRRPRTRPGVLPGGLDMTPGIAAAVQAPPEPRPVAVTDAAERATGNAPREAVPVVVVESAAARIQARLVDDTGRSISLARSALVGRDPAAAPGEEVEHLFAIDDPGRTVSKTHLRIDVSERGVTVTDRGSSNGTSVMIGGVEQTLEAGEPLGVPLGSVLRLGGRTVTVEAP